MTLASDRLYLLRHQLVVRDGATLTIEPGTVVRARGAGAAVIVEPGGRIVAKGTQQAPVVLTCLSSDPRETAPGCWGGLKVLGRAAVTREEGTVPEILSPASGAYGSSEDAGTSGELRYVRVEYAGGSGPALGLYGVGSGTSIDYVQARYRRSDGILFSGGSVACSHCVSEGAAGGAAAIRGSNDSDGFDNQPRSRPALSNVTLIQGGRAASGRPFGLRLEHGSGVLGDKLLSAGYERAVWADASAGLLFRGGESRIEGSLFHGFGSRALGGFVQAAAGDGIAFMTGDPRLRDLRAVPNPDPRPEAGSPALGETRFIGAFDADSNWLQEWTVFGHPLEYAPAAQ